MYLIRSLTIISIFLLVSCGEGPKKNLKSETELPIEGFGKKRDNSICKWSASRHAFI